MTERITHEIVIGESLPKFKWRTEMAKAPYDVLLFIIPTNSKVVATEKGHSLHDQT